MFRRIFQQDEENREFKKVKSLEMIEAERVRKGVQPIQITINSKEGRNLASIRNIQLRNVKIKEMTQRASFTKIEFETPVDLKLERNIITTL